jgi:anti-sigma-K factor RskA
MSTRPPLPDSDELLAAELALGLLADDERGPAEVRLRTDPAFAAAHDWWREHATALTTGFDEAPPPAVWNAIAARLPANDAAAVPLARLRAWQGLAGVAAAAAIVLGVLLARPTPPLAPVVVSAAPPLVAVLSDPKRDAVVTVSVDRAARTVAVAPSRLEPGAGDAELWVIPADGTPRALGVLAARQRATLRLAPTVAFAVQPGSTLAVSLEPRGGSPTGLPTGPVILTGKIAQS